MVFINIQIQNPAALSYVTWPRVSQPVKGSETRKQAGRQALVRPSQAYSILRLPWAGWGWVSLDCQGRGCSLL